MLSEISHREDRHRIISHSCDIYENIKDSIVILARYSRDECQEDQCIVGNLTHRTENAGRVEKGPTLTMIV